MKSSTVLASSLVLNLVIVGVFILRPALAPAAVREALGRVDQPSATAAGSGAMTGARGATARTARTGSQGELWTRLATDDLNVLVARLRAAGFPPTIIRSIIQAEINRRYQERQRTLIEGSADVPYWRASSLNPGLNSARYEEYLRLQRERSNLQRELFKDPFFATEEVSAAQRRQYGDLPRAKIETLTRIEADYEEMIAMVRSGANGILLSEDKANLALLAREKRADLAAVLSPAELADYEVRSSPITRLVGSRLGEFRATEAEFRAIFDGQKDINDRFPYLSGGGMIGASMAERRAAEQQVNVRLREQFGPERFADFLRETADDYQQLRRIAQQQNIPVETARRAHHLRDAVAEESTRIYNDGALSPEQKRTALAALAQDTRAQMINVLGPTAGPAYVKIIEPRWLSRVESGSAVAFDGPPNSSYGSNDVMVSVGGGPTFRMAAPPLAAPRPAPGP